MFKPWAYAMYLRLILATPLVYVSGLSVAAANGAGELSQGHPKMVV